MSKARSCHMWVCVCPIGPPYFTHFDMFENVQLFVLHAISISEPICWWRCLNMVPLRWHIVKTRKVILIWHLYTINKICCDHILYFRNAIFKCPSLFPFLRILFSDTYERSTQIKSISAITQTSLLLQNSIHIWQQLNSSTDNWLSKFNE